MERKEVTKDLFSHYDDQMEFSSASECAEWLLEEAEEFGGNPRVVFYSEYGYDGDYTVKFYLSRPETDEEMAARIKAEQERSARYKAEWTARERQQYEYLKAKFGD